MSQSTWPCTPFVKPTGPRVSTWPCGPKPEKKPGTCPDIPALPQAQIDYIANKAYYVISINPRQVLLNNIGIDTFYGGGNLWAGESAKELDDVINFIDNYYTRPAFRTTFCAPDIHIDVGVFVADFVKTSSADVKRLRSAFFLRYGLNKPNVYGSPA